MNAQTDQQLLRDYAGSHSEAAFAELVRRHIDLVYSAALRMVCDSHQAEDVTQGVFVALAQNSRQLTHHPVLSGWLHRTTQNLAANAVRTNVRRQTREQEAAAMNELLSAGSDVSWEHIAPHLDAALGALSEPDRDAVLLRYFERKSAQEMAERLGISAEAAQKRVSRAVERVREFFAKRGVTVGVSGLVTLIAANAVQAAPIGLAITISTAAAALGGTAIATTATATATKAIAMTTFQKTIVTATVAVLAGVGVYEARQVSQLRAQVRTLQQQPRPVHVSSNDAVLLTLQGRLDLLTAQNAELTNALAQANADRVRLATEREQAKRAAALFKELADQAGPGDKSSTNAYPTARHVWAGMGRLMALSSEDQSKLSPEEKSALDAARMRSIEEIPKLVKAAKQFEKDESSKSDSQAADNRADMGACLLYGALNLDEQQFGQVYGLIHKFQQEARQGDLLGENPTPETATALKQMMEQFKTEMQTLLTPEQARIFAGVLPHIQVGGGRFSFDFKF